MNQLAHWILASALLVATGCEATSTSQPHAAGRIDPGSPRPAARGDRGVYREPSERLTAPYPPGRWRLATHEQLEQAMLWPAHVLIRHREVAPGLVSFTVPLWTAAPSPPERTRHAALELAQELSTELRARPEKFAELARQRSEDIATRAAGGAFGGLNALRLRDWPEVLDALSALKPGEVSRVVETGYGFHVFLLRRPPVERQLSGAHIVIGYDEAPWLHRFLARRPIPPRSRAQAGALADRVYREARQAPAEFARFVEQYSEQYDAETGGDFGQWSTLEPTPHADAVELLQGLEPGEIAPPIDSPFGFRIIQRTPERARERYGEAIIQHRYDVGRADADPRSRSSVRRKMEDVLLTVRAEPARFGELQSLFCCREVKSFDEGRGPPREEQVVRQLALGAIATELLEIGDRFAIIRRVEPGEATPRSPSIGLPAPEKPDPRFFFSTNRGRAETWRHMGEVAAELPGLDAEQRARLREVHDRPLASRDPASGEVRVVFTELQSELKRLLGDERYAQYVTLLEQEVERASMAAARGPMTMMAQ